MKEDTLVDGREPGFYIVDNEIIDHYGSTIGPYGLAVYNVLSYYANKKGEQIFPSYQTIADKIGISRPKVVKAIQQLVDLKLITKTARHKETGESTSNQYTLVNVKGGKPHLPPSKPHLPRVVNDVNHGSKPRLPDQDPINNTQLDQEREIALPQPASPNSAASPSLSLQAKEGEYMPGLPDPRTSRTDVIADLMVQVKRMGVGAKQFRLMVDVLLDGCGKKPLADAGDERVLKRAQEVVLTLMIVSDKFKTPEGIQSIFDSWRENDYRGDTVPSSEQVKEHASLMASGKVVCTRKPKQGSTNGQATPSVSRRMQVFEWDGK